MQVVGFRLDVLGAFSHKEPFGTVGIDGVAEV